MDRLEKALRDLKAEGRVTEILQRKDGVTVARVETPDGARVLKAFDNPAYAREIRNYRLLSRLGVPTLRVYAAGKDAFLMEDIADSRWRPGRAEDMEDSAVAGLLAAWYRKLHDAGEAYIRDNPDLPLYDEYALVTEESLALVRRKTGTGDWPVWDFLRDSLPALKRAADALPRVLAYNDFYYVNFAVARDGGEALLFDYNLLGKGTRYADVRNVCCSLSKAAGEAFRAAYGFIPSPAEEAADRVFSPLSALVLACRQEKLPGWAAGQLAALRDGLEGPAAALMEMSCREFRNKRM